MEKPLVAILDLCHSLDEIARDFYIALADAETRPRLRDFWTRMGDEEREHLDYWGRLRELARADMVPQIFDDPVAVAAELEAVENEVRRVLARPVRRASAHERFVAAFWLEFYLLHPALEHLLYFLREVTGSDPEGDYESHIEGFLDAVAACDELTPDLELLGTMIRRLWQQFRLYQHRSHIDPTTDLRNRRGLDEVILPLAHLARRRGESVALLIADIDAFKAINDIYGHQAGDDALRSVAELIESIVRQSDITGRLGGDEFVVFFPAIDGPALEEIAERIRRTVETTPCATRSLTISIGATHGRLNEDISTALQELFRVADACLYQAKAEGRNRVAICPLDEAPPPPSTER